MQVFGNNEEMVCETQACETLLDKNAKLDADVQLKVFQLAAKYNRSLPLSQKAAGSHDNGSLEFLCLLRPAQTFLRLNIF